MMGKDQDMKIAIVSAAHHHVGGYLSALQARTDVTVVGIYDDDPARRARYAQRYRITPYTQLASLIAQRPQLAVICSENSKHAEHAQQCATAGIHILCEKPLATTVTDAQRMVACCKQHNTLLVPALPMRYSSASIEAHTAIRAGTIGEIRGGSATNQGQIPTSHRSWFVDPESAGGGAIIDHTIHVVDMVRWLTAAEVQTVHAFESRLLHASLTTLETAALLTLHLDNGTIFSLDCSWSRPHHYPTWGGLTLRIVGSNGILEADAFCEQSILYGQPAQHTEWHYWGSDSNAALVDDVIKAVRGQSVPQVSAADALVAQRIIAAAYRSAQSGEIVTVF